MRSQRWLQVLRPLPPRARLAIGLMSFVLPIALWALVSYVPGVWHPKMLITATGATDYLQPGMRMDRRAFHAEVAAARKENRAPPEGERANPIYLPAPHEVAEAFYTSFTMPPLGQDGRWLHESLWQSMQVIFWGFTISSIIGVPLGVLCGTFGLFSRLSEPFIEFFRARASVEGCGRRLPFLRHRFDRLRLRARAPAGRSPADSCRARRSSCSGW